MTTQYTANFSLPYPQLTDTPNVPRDIQALATAIDGISIALKSGNLSQFASTTSAQLKGVVSDETGSGYLVFNTSPTLVTPVLGVAGATSLNFPSTTATIPLNGMYSSASNTLNFSTSSTNQFFIDSAGDIWDLTNSTQTSSYLRFGDGTNTYSMFAGYYDSSTTGHIEIYTMGSGTITERMRIDNAGNIVVQGPIQTYATSTTSTNSAALAISSGNATGTTSNSGAVTIDAGTATGTAGTITIGGTNASGLTIGRSAVTTTINGTTSHSGAVFMTGGITYLYQPAITTISTTGASTLTIAQLLTEIVNYTGSNTATFTLPTGTLMDGGVSGIVNNVSFDWSIVNTVAFAITMSAGSSHTYVGNTTVAASVSARFRSVRTGTTTWVTYRLS